MGTSTTFGALLRRYRQEAALSQESLAERAGLSVDAVSVIERGKRGPPRPDTVAMLASALGLAGERRATFIAAARPQSTTPVDVAPISFEPCDAAPCTNLPAALSSFIGREQEQAEILMLLARARLVTLVGAGGSGKTRLGLRVAEEAASDYPDGVWLVELAPLADPMLAPGAVAQALGVREDADKTVVDGLVRHLKSRRLLLVLDNCEHLLDACAVLAAALLRAAPHLRILATSREGLRITGEHIYRVPALAVPPLDHLPALADLGAFPAVALFVARARERRATFTLSATNAQAVAAVCTRLDGMPLAIELAAARVESLPVEVIAARLDDCFKLLTIGPRAALPRQQTLRAMLDWSWALLSQAERTLLARLSMFAMGWTLEAAEGVCGGDGIENSAIQNLLAALVSKSLVQSEEQSGGDRFTLLETVRQYAAEKFETAGARAAWADRHLDWYLALAEEAEPKLTGPEQETWVARLEGEHYNLQTALGWARERGAGESWLRLAGALSRFWLRRGYFSQGRIWLEAALAACTGGAPAARAKALTGAGTLAHVQGEYGRALLLYEESLALERELGNKQRIAHVLGNLGDLARVQGDYRRASTHLQEQLTLVREMGDKWSIASTLAYLGELARDQGDNTQARSLFEEALMLGRELGNKSGIAWALSDLGDLAREQGDQVQARAMLEETLALWRELGEKRSIAHALAYLGDLVREQGDQEQASALLGEALTLAREVGDKWCVAHALSNLGQLARRRGQYGQARTLFQEALAIRRELGNQSGIAWSLKDLGALFRDQGDYEQASVLLHEALTLTREIGDTRGIAHVLGNLGELARRRGDYEQARILLHEALAVRRELGNNKGTAWSLCDLSDLAREVGDYERAQALLQEALTLRWQLRDDAGIAQCLAGIEQPSAMYRAWDAVAHLFGANQALPATPSDLPANVEVALDQALRFL